MAAQQDTLRDSVILQAMIDRSENPQPLRETIATVRNGLILLDGQSWLDAHRIAYITIKRFGLK